MAALSHPDLIPPHPRFLLATYPTPLERALHLELALRTAGGAAVPRIYLKRDDLLSLGVGGNKIRNLEFSIGQALDERATDVITVGRPQSNHCRLTAAACSRAGLRAHLVLTGARPPRLSGNLLLDELFGGRLYFTGTDDRESRKAWVEMLLGGLASMGCRPFLIPVGGSDARGALGHVLAAAELLGQLGDAGEQKAVVTLATATGGTQAGMLAGFAKLRAPMVVQGFAVAGSADALAADVLRIANEVAGDIDGPSIEAPDVVVHGSELGAGYGVPTSSGEDALRLLARTEGLVADPVYTAKGFAGLLAMIRAGRFAPDAAVVFVHTGGAPALFAS